MSEPKEAEAALEKDSLDEAFSAGVGHVVPSLQPQKPKDPRSRHKYNLVSRILFL